jgi:tetratricopeptide (TPR) repeat protein
MKIRFLVIGLLGLVSITAYAQKGELSNAADNFKKYQVFKSAGNDAVLPSLMAAKASIDKAAVNDKTGTLPQTYALKGAIYAVLTVRDTVPATSAPLFTTAEESLKKAKEVDTKGEYKDMIEDGFRNLAQYEQNEGVNEYKAKKYDLAYSAFDKYREIMPEDTNAIYFTALSAANAQKNDAAILNFNRLLATKYSQNALIYYDLSNLYLNAKDTTASLKAVTDGIAKYPTNGELRKRQIEIYLKEGKQQEVIGLIQTAITNDPKNKSLYYYGAFTYTQLADMTDAAQKKIKDPAEKDKMEQSKLDNYSKAAELYKKALEIDPNFFEANLNIGYVLMKPGIDVYNAAQQLPSSKQKEYDADIAKAGALLDSAKPYMLKAVDLNPKSVDALMNLKTYYIGKHDMASANDVQKKIDALK